MFQEPSRSPAAGHQAGSGRKSLAERISRTFDKLTSASTGVSRDADKREMVGVHPANWNMYGVYAPHHTNYRTVRGPYGVSYQYVYNGWDPPMPMGVGGYPSDYLGGPRHNYPAEGSPYSSPAQKPPCCCQDAGKDSIRSKTGLKGLKNVIGGSRCNQCHRSRSVAPMDMASRQRQPPHHPPAIQRHLPAANGVGGGGPLSRMLPERPRSPPAGRPVAKRSPGGPRDPYDYLRRTQLKTNDEWDTYWDYTALLAANNNNNNNNRAKQTGKAASNDATNRGMDGSPSMPGRATVDAHNPGRISGFRSTPHAHLIGGSVGRHRGGQMAAFAAAAGTRDGVPVPTRARVPRGGGSPPPSFGSGLSKLGDPESRTVDPNSRSFGSIEVAASARISESGGSRDKFMSNGGVKDGPAYKSNKDDTILSERLNASQSEDEDDFEDEVNDMPRKLTPNMDSIQNKLTACEIRYRKFQRRKQLRTKLALNIDEAILEEDEEALAEDDCGSGMDNDDSEPQATSHSAPSSLLLLPTITEDTERSASSSDDELGLGKFQPVTMTDSYNLAEEILSEIYGTKEDPGDRKVASPSIEAETSDLNDKSEGPSEDAQSKSDSNSTQSEADKPFIEGNEEAKDLLVKETEAMRLRSLADEILDELYGEINPPTNDRGINQEPENPELADSCGLYRSLSLSERGPISAGAINTGLAHLLFHEPTGGLGRLRLPRRASTAAAGGVSPATTGQLQLPGTPTLHRPLPHISPSGQPVFRPSPLASTEAEPTQQLSSLSASAVKEVLFRPNLRPFTSNELDRIQQVIDKEVEASGPENSGHHPDNLGDGMTSTLKKSDMDSLSEDGENIPSVRPAPEGAEDETATNRRKELIDNCQLSISGQNSKSLAAFSVNPLAAPTDASSNLAVSMLADKDKPVRELMQNALQGTSGSERGVADFAGPLDLSVDSTDSSQDLDISADSLIVPVDHRTRHQQHSFEADSIEVEGDVLGEMETKSIQLSDQNAGTLIQREGERTIIRSSGLIITTPATSRSAERTDVNRVYISSASWINIDTSADSEKEGSTQQTASHQEILSPQLLAYDANKDADIQLPLELTTDTRAGPRGGLDSDKVAGSAGEEPVKPPRLKKLARQQSKQEMLRAKGFGLPDGRSVNLSTNMLDDNKASRSLSLLTTNKESNSPLRERPEISAPILINSTLNPNDIDTHRCITVKEEMTGVRASWSDLLYRPGHSDNENTSFYTMESVLGEDGGLYNEHIYEEIPEQERLSLNSRPLPPIPEAASDSSALAFNRSIFTGATKSEILHYLQDARLRIGNNNNNNNYHNNLSSAVACNIGNCAHPHHNHGSVLSSAHLHQLLSYQGSSASDLPFGLDHELFSPRSGGNQRFHLASTSSVESLVGGGGSSGIGSASTTTASMTATTGGNNSGNQSDEGGYYSSDGICLGNRNNRHRISAISNLSDSSNDSGESSASNSSSSTTGSSIGTGVGGLAGNNASGGNWRASGSGGVLHHPHQLLVLNEKGCLTSAEATVAQVERHDSGVGSDVGYHKITATVTHSPNNSRGGKRAASLSRRSDASDQFEASEGHGREPDYNEHEDDEDVIELPAVTTTPSLPEVKTCTDCEDVIEPPEDPLLSEEEDLETETPKSESESNLCGKCIKRKGERKEIISEIVETEIKYGNDLTIIMDEFFRPMQVAGLLTSEQLSNIFLNVEQLIEVNKSFSSRLKESLELALAGGDEDLLSVDIGSIFLDSLPMLQAYEEYCTKQAASSMLLASVEREKELLRVFLKVSQLENKILRRMNLSSFLMVPVQRITKYPLLLSRLCKVTPMHHPDRERIRQAQVRIESALEQINKDAKEIGGCGSGLGGGYSGSTTLSGNSWRRTNTGSSSSLGGSGGGKSGANSGKVPIQREMNAIRVRKLALEMLGWSRDETKFALEGRLVFAHVTDSSWRSKWRGTVGGGSSSSSSSYSGATSASGLKLTTAKALLVVTGCDVGAGGGGDLLTGGINLCHPSGAGGGSSGAGGSASAAEEMAATHMQIIFGHEKVREAVLLLVREKTSRFSTCRDPFYLGKSIISKDNDLDDCFEIQEFGSRDSYIFRAEDSRQNLIWFQTLQLYSQSLGGWRRRRKGLANIMVDPGPTNSS